MIPPEEITGLFAGRSGFKDKGVAIEIRFFPSSVSTGGTAHIRAFWEEDNQGFSEIGKYKYSAESGYLTLKLSADSVINGFTTTVEGGNPPVFSTDGIRFIHKPETDLKKIDVEPDDIAGIWVMNYEFDGEPVKVTLVIDPVAVFSEVTHYNDDDEDLIYEGHYQLDGKTGLITFFYSPGPESGYTGFFNREKESIYTREGDFHRL